MKKAFYRQITYALDRFSVHTSEILVTIAAIVLAVLMFLTTGDVILRYVFSHPLAWSYELTRLLLLIIIFFGVSYVAITRSNVRIDVLTRRLSQRSQAILNVTSNFLGLLLIIFVTWQGVMHAINLYEAKQIFSNLNLPVYVALIMLCIGCSAFCLCLLRGLLGSLQEVFGEEGQKIWLWVGLGTVTSSIVFLAPFWYPLSGLELGSAGWGILGVVLFLLLLVSGLPIAFSMALAGFVAVGCLISIDAGLNLLRTAPAATSMRYTFSVVPLFVLMGQFAYQSDIIKDLYYSMSKWLGRLPGGLAIASIGGCAGFAAVCGSSVASGAAMSAICYPELKRHKYDPGLATGSIAAGGTLGIMIPPSLDFIIYGVLTLTSIGALFIAGIFPGLLMAIFFMLTAYFLCRRNPRLGPPGPPSTLKEKILATGSVGPILALFLLIIGGIYLGVFSPTEAGGIGAFGSFVIALIKRRLTWKKFLDSLKNTVATTAMILIILIGAMILGYFLTLTEIPLKLAAWLTTLAANRWIIIVGVMLMYIALGCIMDSFATMIITVPIIFPAMMSLGFDPVWFGVLMIITVEIGLITPPVGLLAFIISGVTKEVSIGTVFRGIVPFLIADFFVVALIMAFPQISLFLPSLMR